MELVVSTAVLAFIFGIVFLLFSYALNGYAALDARQGVQGAALKARVTMERDFSLSHFLSMGTVDRDFEGHERDIVCMLGLSNWSDEGAFASNGLPRWDRQIVYYAHADREDGRLMRAVLAPDTPPGLDCLRIAPVAAGLLGQVDQAVPPGELAMIERQQVVDGVQEFSCRSDPAYQLVEVRLSLRRVSGLRGGEGVARTEETMEAVFQFDPLNTSPRL